MTRVEREKALRIRMPFGFYRAVARDLADSLGRVSDQDKLQTLGSYMRSFENWMRYYAENEMARIKNKGDHWKGLQSIPEAMAISQRVLERKK